MSVSALPCFLPHPAEAQTYLFLLVKPSKTVDIKRSSKVKVNAGLKLFTCMTIIYLSNAQGIGLVPVIPFCSKRQKQHRWSAAPCGSRGENEATVIIFFVPISICSLLPQQFANQLEESNSELFVQLTFYWKLSQCLLKLTNILNVLDAK